MDYLYFFKQFKKFLARFISLTMEAYFKEIKKIKY